MGLQSSDRSRGSAQQAEPLGGTSCGLHRSAWERRLHPLRDRCLIWPPSRDFVVLRLRLVDEVAVLVERDRRQGHRLGRVEQPLWPIDIPEGAVIPQLWPGTPGAQQLAVTCTVGAVQLTSATSVEPERTLPASRGG